MFNLRSSSEEEICTAGEKISENLYNGKLEESLNSLQYKRFCEKVVSNTYHQQQQQMSQFRCFPSDSPVEGF